MKKRILNQSHRGNELYAVKKSLLNDNVIGSYALAMECYQECIQLDPTSYDSVVEKLAECCLQEMRISDALTHWKYLTQYHPTILASERLAECYLLTGNLSTSHFLLHECEEAISTNPCEDELQTQIKATKEAVTKCEQELTHARQWLAVNQPEKAIHPLLVCRECSPYWRTPFLLLLRCYVKGNQTEEAYSLLLETCPWFCHIESQHNLSSIRLSPSLYYESKDPDEFDSTFVSLRRTSYV